ncbi:hypothetical protein SAMD00079811_28610 [Scytonema sp. HK-05]|uniref:hypothetical protein n=1 Tax=Scytonema sp. HK-05 TaxID=1137095 RepID=UPI000935FC03|nr:hypothetical protein [Scytonema sp. HK-05]OKH53824.1 hypothetical protein NIES2130_29710 [Scytonema sp. HK-05]BAY45258.1 hypothetical protein SAMD00079811_28610 [Scytonema sp. HK-05]
MPQDNQNSQPPFSPEPEDNQPQPMVESTAQPPRKQYQRAQPIWKATIIQILRGTIGVLETTVEKLETAPPPGSEETPGFLQKLQLGWSAALGKIRSLLPTNLSRKLSDTALTGIIAGIAVLLVWTTSTVFSGKPTEVATVPPTEETPPATIAIPPELEAPPTPPAGEETPLPAEEITPPPTQETPPPVAKEETPPPAEEITPPPTQETPPPVAEITPPTVEETPPSEPEPEPTPTPTLVLTPEQTLIASIENQVAQISDRFASGLIQSIQANFRSSSLALTISEEWYNLKQEQQEKLLAQMLQRSKELDFSHLDILDPQGRLVARNPVVGTNMIIFQRRATT